MTRKQPPVLYHASFATEQWTCGKPLPLELEFHANSRHGLSIT